MNRTLCVLFEGSQASGSRRSPSTARRWRSLVTFRSGFRFFSDLCATIGILALVVCGLGRPEVSVISGSSPSGAVAAGGFSFWV